MKRSRMILIAVLAMLLVVMLCACNHDHQYVVITDEEATCTQPGKTHEECTVCGDWGEETEVPPLDHLYDKDADNKDVWDFDAEEHWHECTRCGEKQDKAGHTLSAQTDFVCSTCGYAIFEYEEMSDGYVLTKYNGADADVVIPQTYKQKKVVGIADDVFYQNATIKSISLSENINRIGRDAFYGMTSLNTVKAASLQAWLGIEFANYAANPMSKASEIYFGNAKQESSVVIPASVSEIKEYAFYGFGTITDITLHGGVTAIGYRAFEGAFKKDADITVNAESLQNWCAISFAANRSDVEGMRANPLSMGATLKIDGNAIEGRLDLGGIGKIGDYAFYGYDKITDVECAAEIGKYAFANCGALISASVDAANIPDGLFAGCALLDSVTLSNATSIGASAFENCKALASITIPETVTEMGEKAFEGCEALSEVNGAEGLKKVGTSAFFGTGLFETAGENAFTLVYVGNVLVGAKGKLGSAQNEGDIEVRAGTVAIAGGALSNVENLTSVKLPESLKYIGKDAMRYTGIVTSKLASVELGGTLEIGEGAFAGSALARIQLTASLEKIGSGAFTGCTALKEVYVEGIEVLLGIEFADANANPLTLSKALYIGTYDPDATDKPTATTLITIPDGTTEIGAYAFSGLSGVSGVVLPTSLTKIGKGAFEGCSALRSVFYKGTTEEEYKAIKIEDGAIGGNTTSVYYFSAERPEQSVTNYWHFDNDIPTRWY